MESMKKDCITRLDPGPVVYLDSAFTTELLKPNT